MFVLKNVLMDENDGANGGSGGSNDDDKIKAAVAAAVSEATTALNKKNQELLNELKTTKEKNKQFENLDLEKLQNLQKHMDESEEAKLIAEGKFDEVFNRRFQRVQEDNNAKLEASNKKAEENDERASRFESLYSKERIRNQGIRAAEKSGVDPKAIDDVVEKVLQRFQLNEEGNLEARDSSGSLIMSKDGKSILQPEEYINETLKSKHPYYWPTSRSGGLGGGSGAGGGVPSSVDDVKTSEAAKTKNMSEFRRLRKAQRGQG